MFLSTLSFPVLCPRSSLTSQFPIPWPSPPSFFHPHSSWFSVTFLTILSKYSLPLFPWKCIPLTLMTLLWLFPPRPQPPPSNRSSSFTAICLLSAFPSWTGPLCRWFLQLFSLVLPSLTIIYKCSFSSKWKLQLGVQTQHVHNWTEFIFFLPKLNTSLSFPIY